MSLETNYYERIKPAKPISKSDAERIFKKFIQKIKFINPEAGNNLLPIKTIRKMKTIIRLAIFTMLAVMPFMTMAQENKSVKQDTTVQKEKTVYVDSCVSWYQHLVGTRMGDKESQLSCDSIKWMYNGKLSASDVYRVYIVKRKDCVGEYTQYFKIPKDKIYDWEGILIRTEYTNELSMRSMQILSGVTYDENYYLKQAGVRTPTGPSERVWLKFWEVKFKNDIEKAKKSK